MTHTKPNYPDFPYTEDQEIWLQALESDAYPKGVSRLKSLNGSYCCLGVACQIFLGDPTYRAAGDGLYWKYKHREFRISLPEILQDRLKLRDDSKIPRVLTLPNINDYTPDEPHSTTAQKIRATPTLYFTNLDK